MSKEKLEKIVRKEIAVLNDRIDEKILRGLSYGTESRRHRFLVARLNQLQRTSSYTQTWFGKVFSFAK